VNALSLNKQQQSTELSGYAPGHITTKLPLWALHFYFDFKIFDGLPVTLSF